MREQRAAGAVIFRPSSQEYLLLKHRDGHWEFPKGKLEPGESVHDAMIREIAEETGIVDAAQIPFTHTSEYSFFYRGKIHKTVEYGILLSEQQPVISSEHLDFGFFSYEKARRLLKFKNHRDLLDAAHSVLSDA